LRKTVYPGSNLKIQKSIAPSFFGPAVAVFQVRRVGGDLVERGHAGGDEDVAADEGAAADDRVAAEDCRPGVDGHVVFDRGVAFLAAEALAEGGGEGAEGHALVDLHVVSDFGGFADDHAGAVVDEEVVAEL